MENLNKTPIIEKFKDSITKIGQLGNYIIPLEFSSVLEEYKAVRTSAGLFDLSYMGELIVKGDDATEFLQYLTTNDISSLSDNEIIYTLMCYPCGGIVDDLVVYKISVNEYIIMTNCNNVLKDYDWMLDNIGQFNVSILNVSNDFGKILIEGPKAKEIIQKLTLENVSKLKFFTFKNNIIISGKPCLLSRRGYTGEDGFEIYLEKQNLVYLWEKVLESGEDLGIKPIGLNTAHILKFEALYPIYGNEINEDISPLEAELYDYIKFEKNDFIGKYPLLREYEDSLSRKLVAFEVSKEGIVKKGQEVLCDTLRIGKVVAVYFLPSLNKSIGLTYIEEKYYGVGKFLNIRIDKEDIIKVKMVERNFSYNYKIG